MAVKRRRSVVNSWVTEIGDLALQIARKTTLAALQVAGIEREAAVEKISFLLQSFLEVPASPTIRTSRPSITSSPNNGRVISPMTEKSGLPSIVMVDDMESVTSQTYDLVADMKDLDGEGYSSEDEVVGFHESAKKVVTFIGETIEEIENDVSAIGLDNLNLGVADIKIAKDSYQKLQLQLKDVNQKLTIIQEQLSAFGNVMEKNRHFFDA